MKHPFPNLLYLSSITVFPVQQDISFCRRSVDRSILLSSFLLPSILIQRLSKLLIERLYDTNYIFFKGLKVYKDVWVSLVLRSWSVFIALTYPSSIASFIPISRWKGQSSHFFFFYRELFMVQWQKVLYQLQPYPDNYSGGQEQFLKELRKNCDFIFLLLLNSMFQCRLYNIVIGMR